MVSRAERLARQARLDEVTALLLRSDSLDYYDELAPWERQLLGALQRNGITKIEDLTREKQEFVKAGLGIAGIASSRSFAQHILNSDDLNEVRRETFRIKIIEPQLTSQEVSDRRYAEIRVLLSSVEDGPYMRQQLTMFQNMYRSATELKNPDITSERKSEIMTELYQDKTFGHVLDRMAEDKGELKPDDILRKIDKEISEILPKVYLNPIQQKLLETVQAHGIQTLDDLAKPQNAIWVMRGMPGTFLEHQVELQPSQSYGILEAGETQTEIRHTLDERAIATMSSRFKDSLLRVQTGNNVRPYDIENAAILAMNGIYTVEDVDSEAGRRIALNAETVFAAQMPGTYNGECNPMKSLDSRGFPEGTRSEGLDTMLNAYIETNRILTKQEMRFYQAEKVMNKVESGETLAGWEQVLYTGLATAGVTSADDLSKPLVKEQIEKGLGDAFKTVPECGFEKLSVNDLQPVVAYRLDLFNKQNSIDKKPEKLPKGTELSRLQSFRAIEFKNMFEIAFFNFEHGYPLSAKDEELLATAVLGNMKTQKDVLVVPAVESPLFTNVKLYEKIHEGYDFTTGDVLQNVSLDEQGFIVGKDYAPGVKDFILKLREAVKEPAGRRTMPATPLLPMDRINKARAFAKAMAPNDEVIVPQEKMSEKALQDARLEEAKRLLEKAQNPINTLNDQEFYLLARLNDNGIKQPSDLGTFKLSNKRLVREGLGLKDIKGKTFAGYMMSSKQNDLIFADETTSQQRYMEATMILEKFNDHDHLMEQMDALKEAYRASEMLDKGGLSAEDKARYEAIVQAHPAAKNYSPEKRSANLLKDIQNMTPLAYPPPHEMLLYETLVAHGIKKADDLDLASNELWVRRGMPGSFIDKQVHLQPNQSFSVLAMGFTQEEIARNKQRELVNQSKVIYNTALSETLTVQSSKDKVENAALMACYGIRSAADLETPKAHELLKDGDKLLTESFSMYVDGKAIHSRADGFADTARNDDMNRMIEGFKANGVLPTIQEVRLQQAKDVVSKIMNGQKMAEWEQVLYAGLANSGVSCVADLDKPEIKSFVEQGMSGKFEKDTQRGFNTLKYDDVSEQVANRVLLLQDELAKTQSQSNVEASRRASVDKLSIMRDFSKIMEKIDLYEMRVERPMMVAKQKRNVQTKTGTKAPVIRPPVRTGGRD